LQTNIAGNLFADFRAAAVIFDVRPPYSFM